MRIPIVPYSPTWPEDFSRLSTYLSRILPENSYLSIEHVGSTAVPGLPAKPMIDLDVVIASISDLKLIEDALTRSKAEGGGNYVSCGEWGIPGRYAFRRKWQMKARDKKQSIVGRAKTDDDPGKRNGQGTKEDVMTTAVDEEGAKLQDDNDEVQDLDEPVHNLYVCLEGCLSLRNHLAVRDLCRKNEEARKRYADVKMELAQKDWKDVNSYSEAKTEVLSWILEKAGISGEERDSVKKANEIKEEKKEIKVAVEAAASRSA